MPPSIIDGCIAIGAAPATDCARHRRSEPKASWNRCGRVAKWCLCLRNVCLKAHMDSGLKNIKRAELRARLSELDYLIAEQTSHANFIREMGWNVPVAEERLEKLKLSRRACLAALEQLLGDQAERD